MWLEEDGDTSEDDEAGDYGVPGDAPRALWGNGVAGLAGVAFMVGGSFFHFYSGRWIVGAWPQGLWWRLITTRAPVICPVLG